MAKGFKTGGRVAGTPNRKTAALRAAMAEAAARVEELLGSAASSADAHALLVAIYKNAGLPIELRLEAAKAAIRYEKPALAAVAHRTGAGLAARPKEERDATVAAALRADS